MLVLGIEAATPVAGVALVRDNVLLAERMVNNKKTHSINLLPMIKAILEEAGVVPGDLQGIAVSSGPGSFTGIRIGMSTAKTLAQVWGLPVAGINTLETLAQPFTGCGGLVCPVLNARKNEVYFALYRLQAGAVEVVMEPGAMDPSGLAQTLSKLDQPVVFTGDALFEYSDLFCRLMGAKALFASGSSSLPRGAAVAELGVREFKACRGVDPLLLLPTYIRLSEAETKWLLKNRGPEACSHCS